MYIIWVLRVLCTVSLFLWGILSEATQWMPGPELYWILYVLCFSYSEITVTEFINWGTGKNSAKLERWLGVVKSVAARAEDSGSCPGMDVAVHIHEVSKFNSRFLGALCACGT